MFYLLLTSHATNSAKMKRINDLTLLNTITHSLTLSQTLALEHAHYEVTNAEEIETQHVNETL
jgi:hypothetical protein